MRAAAATLLAAALFGLAVAAQEPADEERLLFEAAQQSGRVEDFTAYVEQFPYGTFAEAARFELELRGVTLPPPAPVTFTAPLAFGPEGVKGRSIAQLLESGSPLYPPIEGLPEEIWKGKPCTTCHHWTPEDLCTQAQTYGREDTADRLVRPHPLGVAFKQALKAFGAAGCPRE